MIDRNLFIAQTINFILLIFLLYRLLYKPVKSFMDKRTSEIEQQIKSAKENQEATEALRSELEEQAKQTRQQARLFLDEATKRSEEIQAEMLAEAKEEAASIIRRAREVSKLEQEKAWAELKDQVGELSLLLASKVIDQTLDQNAHQKLINDTMNQLDSLDKGSLQ